VRRWRLHQVWPAMLAETEPMPTIMALIDLVWHLYLPVLGR
jgi:hypothetical protein